MANKKKKSKNKSSSTEKKEVRLRKARKWINKYKGSPKKIAGKYREKFHVGIIAAIKDLQAIGVKFTQEYIDAVKKSEEERIRQKHLLKEKNKLQDSDFYDDWSDNTFAFIAGYTSGGAPYGTTWEELGIEPYAPYEELLEAYERRMDMDFAETYDEDDDLDFPEEYDEDDDLDFRDDFEI